MDLAPLFALALFSLTAAASSACNRTYGGQTVPYPFGFSAECPIRLTYSSDGDILLGNFTIRNFTSQTVTLAVPVNCDRPSRNIAGLFGPNYAMTETNALFLRNCSGGVSECRIDTSIITQRLNKTTCQKDDDIRCYSNGSDRHILSKVQFEKAMNNCSSLFTVVWYGLNELNQTMLMFEAAEVGWWLDGGCRCAANASCTNVDLGNVRRKGFRCKCSKGFEGDGFADGDGCRPIGVLRLVSGQINGGKWKNVVYITVPLVAAAASFICIIFIICMRKRKSTKVLYEASNIDDIDCAESLLFDLSALQDATANFHEDNKLGEGGFGAVYKGVLPDGREIAVKRLAANSWQGLRELKNELVLVAKLQHKNLVSLLGVCVDKEKMIVYEFVPNGSLDSFLQDPARREQLHWGTRFIIIRGIARGLQYLHNESRLTVVHRDLKASNILLDANMNPKITDFGLARLFHGEQTHKSTSRIVGTFGYMAPEYVMHGQYSIRSDVFSFGVLVLEIITGRKSNGFEDAQHSDLLSYVWKNWIDGTIAELLERSALGEDWPRSEVLRCIQIGLLCVEKNANDRPNMSTVVMALSGSTVSLRAPSQPAFWTGTRSLADLNAESF